MSRRSTFHVGPAPAGPGTPSCGHDTYPQPPTHRGYDRVEWSCKLAAGHDGEHDAGSNWRGHFESEARDGTLTVEGRHSHGYSNVRFASREQVDEFCAWLQAQADEAFQ